MSYGSLARSLVVCVGIPVTEVAALVGTVGRGTLVLAAGDVDTARKLLGSADEPTLADGSPEPAMPDVRAIRVGRLTIDPPAREVFSGRRAVRLSAREFDLLTLLASDLHRVWPFEALVRALWHTDYLGDHEQLASTVKRLRKRLGPDTGCEVHSVHGVGYRLLPLDSAVA